MGKYPVRCAFGSFDVVAGFQAMVDGPLIPQPTTLRFSNRVLAGLIMVLLFYWGTFALTAPVTTWDAQVYNVARLAVAERAGFWQGDAWNSQRQVFFPWAFDAIHFPFLKLGWGFALPSFVALLGIIAVVFGTISQSAGTRAALFAVLAIISMPTIMLQATTTKNDLAIVFGIACWLYSLVRFRRSQNIFFCLWLR
jgi:hypothetical protein